MATKGDILKTYRIQINTEISKAKKDVEELRTALDSKDIGKGLATEVEASMERAENAIANLERSVATKMSKLSESINSLKLDQLKNELNGIKTSVQQTAETVTTQVGLMTAALAGSDAGKFDIFIGKIIQPLVDLTKAVDNATKAISKLNGVKVGAVDTSNLTKAAKNTTRSVKTIQAELKAAVASISSVELTFNGKNRKGLQSELTQLRNVIDLYHEATNAGINANKVLSDFKAPGDIFEIREFVKEARGKLRPQKKDEIELKARINVTFDPKKDLDTNAINEYVERVKTELVEKVQEAVDQTPVKLKFGWDIEKDQKLKDKDGNDITKKLDTDEALYKTLRINLIGDETRLKDSIAAIVAKLNNEIADDPRFTVKVNIVPNDITKGSVLWNLLNGGDNATIPVNTNGVSGEVKLQDTGNLAQEKTLVEIRDLIANNKGDNGKGPDGSSKPEAEPKSQGKDWNAGYHRVDAFRNSATRRYSSLKSFRRLINDEVLEKAETTLYLQRQFRFFEDLEKTVVSDAKKSMGKKGGGIKDSRLFTESIKAANGKEYSAFARYSEHFKGMEVTLEEWQKYLSSLGSKALTDMIGQIKKNAEAQRKAVQDSLVRQGIEYTYDKETKRYRQLAPDASLNGAEKSDTKAILANLSRQHHELVAPYEAETAATERYIEELKERKSIAEELVKAAEEGKDVESGELKIKQTRLQQLSKEYKGNTPEERAASEKQFMSLIEEQRTLIAKDSPTESDLHRIEEISHEITFCFQDVADIMGVARDLLRVDTETGKTTIDREIEANEALLKMQRRRVKQASDYYISNGRTENPELQDNMFAMVRAAMEHKNPTMKYTEGGFKKGDLELFGNNSKKLMLYLDTAEQYEQDLIDLYEVSQRIADLEKLYGTVPKPGKTNELDFESGLSGPESRALKKRRTERDQLRKRIKIYEKYNGGATAEKKSTLKDAEESIVTITNSSLEGKVKTDFERVYTRFVNQSQERLVEIIDQMTPEEFADFRQVTTAARDYIKSHGTDSIEEKVQSLQEKLIRSLEASLDLSKQDMANPKTAPKKRLELAWKISDLEETLTYFRDPNAYIEANDRSHGMAEQARAFADRIGGIDLGSKLFEETSDRVLVTAQEMYGIYARKLGMRKQADVTLFQRNIDEAIEFAEQLGVDLNTKFSEMPEEYRKRFQDILSRDLKKIDKIEFTDESGQKHISFEETNLAFMKSDTVASAKASFDSAYNDYRENILKSYTEDQAKLFLELENFLYQSMREADRSRKIGRLTRTIDIDGVKTPELAYMRSKRLRESLASTTYGFDKTITSLADRMPEFEGRRKPSLPAVQTGTDKIVGSELLEQRANRSINQTLEERIEENNRIQNGLESRIRLLKEERDAAQELLDIARKRKENEDNNPEIVSNRMLSYDDRLEMRQSLVKRRSELVEQMNRELAPYQSFEDYWKIIKDSKHKQHLYYKSEWEEIINRGGYELNERGRFIDRTAEAEEFHKLRNKKRRETYDYYGEELSNLDYEIEKSDFVIKKLEDGFRTFWKHLKSIGGVPENEFFSKYLKPTGELNTRAIADAFHVDYSGGVFSSIKTGLSVDELEKRVKEIDAKIVGEERDLQSAKKRGLEFSKSSDEAKILTRDRKKILSDFGQGAVDTANRIDAILAAFRFMLETDDVLSKIQADWKKENSKNIPDKKLLDSYKESGEARTNEILSSDRAKELIERLVIEQIAARNYGLTVDEESGRVFSSKRYLELLKNSKLVPSFNESLIYSPEELAARRAVKLQDNNKQETSEAEVSALEDELMKLRFQAVKTEVRYRQDINLSQQEINELRKASRYAGMTQEQADAAHELAQFNKRVRGKDKLTGAESWRQSYLQEIAKRAGLDINEKGYAYLKGFDTDAWIRNPFAIKGNTYTDSIFDPLVKERMEKGAGSSSTQLALESTQQAVLQAINSFKNGDNKSAGSGADSESGEPSKTSRKKGSTSTAKPEEVKAAQKAFNDKLYKSIDDFDDAAKEAAKRAIEAGYNIKIAKGTGKYYVGNQMTQKNITDASKDVAKALGITLPDLSKVAPKTTKAKSKGMSTSPALPIKDLEKQADVTQMLVSVTELLTKAIDAFTLANNNFIEATKKSKDAIDAEKKSADDLESEIKDLEKVDWNTISDDAKQKITTQFGDNVDVYKTGSQGKGKNARVQYRVVGADKTGIVNEKGELDQKSVKILDDYTRQKLAERRAAEALKAEEAQRLAEEKQAYADIIKLVDAYIGRLKNAARMHQAPDAAGEAAIRDALNNVPLRLFDEGRQDDVLNRLAAGRASAQNIADYRDIDKYVDEYVSRLNLYASGRGQENDVGLILGLRQRIETDLATLRNGGKLLEDEEARILDRMRQARTKATETATKQQITDEQKAQREADAQLAKEEEAQRREQQARGKKVLQEQEKYDADQKKSSDKATKQDKENQALAETVRLYGALLPKVKEYEELMAKLGRGDYSSETLQKLASVVTDIYNGVDAIPAEYKDQKREDEILNRMVAAESSAGTKHNADAFANYQKLTKNLEDYYTLQEKATSPEATKLDKDKFDALKAEWNNASKAAERYYLLQQQADGATLTQEQTDRLRELNTEWLNADESLLKYDIDLSGSADSVARLVLAMQQFRVLNDGGVNRASYLEQAQSAADAVIESLDRILKAGEKTYTQAYKDKVNAAIEGIRKANKNLQSEYSDQAAATLRGAMDAGLKEVFGAKDPMNKKANTAKAGSVLERAIQTRNSYRGMPKELYNEYSRIIDDLRTYTGPKNDRSAGELQATMSRLNVLNARLEESGRKTDGVLGTVSNRLSDMNAKFIAQYFSIQSWIRYMRQVVQTVIQLDTALTELRKVSNAADARLNESMRNSAQTARTLGSTITEVVNATADWARLGYGVDQAEELARVSILYKNVGDNIDIDKASSSLISTLKGYQLGVDQAELIVDKFNEIGNSFAINSAEIGEALKRSAASFNASGTSLDKSIALVTAANTVAQNPESVGTTFKTLAARIRGAKTELEELGVEENEFALTTSKLRNKVKSLTGFDIMKEDGKTYKDVYDILLGIGKQWDKLSDIERASLGEELAGKKNANILYAVLQDTDLLEEIYAKSLNSAGSAMREQENYQRSIQYSINQLKANGQALANDFIDSGLVKGSVAWLSRLVELLDQIVVKTGGLPATLGALFSLATVKSTGGLGNIAGQIMRGTLFKGIGTENIIADEADPSKGIQKGQILGTKVVDKGIGASTGVAILTNLGISAAITLLVSAVTSAYTAMKNGEEAARNTADKLKDNKNLVDDSEVSIRRLRERMADETLAEEQRNKAREDLLSIQNQIVDAYGQEKGYLDLINGDLEEQLRLMKLISSEGYINEGDKVQEGPWWDIFGAFDRSNIEIWNKSRNAINEKQQFPVVETNANTIWNDILATVEGLPDDVKRTLEDGYIDLAAQDEVKVLDTIIEAAHKYEKNNQLDDGQREAVRNFVKTLTTERQEAQGIIDENIQQAISADLYDLASVGIDKSTGVNVYEAAQGAISSSEDLVNAIQNGTATESDYTKNKQLLETLEKIANADEYANLPEIARNAAADIFKLTSGTLNSNYAYTNFERGIREKKLLKSYDLSALMGLSINDITNGNISDKQAKMLAAMARDFKNMGSNAEDVNKKLVEMGIILDENEKKTNKLSQAVPTRGDAIDKLSEMSDGFSVLDKIYADVKDGGTFDFSNLTKKNFTEAFKGLGDDYEEFIEAVSASPDDIQAVQDAFDKMVTSFVNGKISTKDISEENKNVIASYLEMFGVTNSQTYATELLRMAQIEAGIAGADLAAEQEAVALQEQLAAQYGDDLINITYDEMQGFLDHAGASETARVALMNLIASEQVFANQSLNVGAKVAELTQLTGAFLGAAAAASLSTNLDSRKLDGLQRAAAAKGEVFDKNAFIRDQFTQTISDFSNLSVDIPLGYSAPSTGKTGGGGGGGDKSAKQKQLEWLERYINKAADARDEVQKMVDDERTLYDIRIAYNDDLIKAQDEYIRRLDEARILMESEAATLEDQIREKLPDIAETIITKVANGDVTKEGWKDEFEGLDEEAEKLIDNYIDYTDKAKEYTDKVFDEEKTKLDQIQHEFELRINQIKAEMQALENEQEILQHSIDMRETTGSDIIKESDYEELIENADKLAENYYRQLDVLQEQKATLDEGSQAWYDVVSQIYECESAIRDVSKQQAEWNETIKQLPIRRIQRYIQMLQNIKKDIENFNAEQSTLGISTNKQSYVDMFDLDVKQLNKYEQELAKLRDNLKTYTYGTDKFEETANAIQECEDSVSGLIQEMHDYNTAILNIPIDKINEVVEKLEAIKDALSEVQEDNNLAIESAITLLSDQIDKYNEKISDTEKLYQDRIDALQEEEELNSKQLATEKARLQLEKMRGQLTNKVLKNGQWNWAADDSALKDAANNLRDAERQAEIDALEKERDAIIKPWQDEVEKLEKFQNKWEKLRPDRENELNFEKATDIFGDNNWRNKVLTGNDDDLWNKMDQSYNKYMRSIDAYNEQIKDYQQTTAIMSTYIAEYNKGNLTAAEVTAKMNKLIQNAAGGYQSMENLSDTLSAFNEASEDSALRNSTVTVNALYKDFGSYMDIVRDQNEILGQYTQTWDQIHTSVQEQLAELKRLAEIEEQKLKERQAARRERESSDRDSGGGSRTSNIIAVADSHGHVTSGTYDELREQGYVHHSGVLTGYIGAKSKDEKLRALETMSTMDMKRDEVPALLQEGEVVLNKDQQDQLLRNLVPLDDSDMLSRFTLGKDVLNLNAFRAKRLRGGNYVGAGVQMQQTFQFGDINIAEAQNVTDIAHGIMSGGLSQALTQQLYKR